MRRLQALPIALSLPVLLTNRAALRKAGLDPDAPVKTWWELQKVAGAKVKVGFDIRGGEHNGRYYVNLQAWRIHASDESPDAGGGSTPPQRSSSGPSGGGGYGGGGGSKFPSGGGGAPPRSGGYDKPRSSGGGGGYDKPRGGGGRPKPDDDFRGKRGYSKQDEDDIDF